MIPQAVAALVYTRRLSTIEHQSSDLPVVPRLRLAATILWVVAFGLAVWAGVEFRSLQDVSQIDIPLSRAEIVSQDEVVCGRLSKGLPPRRLRWDGEPARAYLVDVATGRAMAPPLIHETTLSLNRRGVLWTEQEGCRFVLDRETLDIVGDSLVIRFDKLRNRTGFYLFGLLAVAAGLLAVLCGQVRRIRSASPQLRARRVFAEIRLSTFILLSHLAFLAFFPGLPDSRMSSDAKNIGGFAAALDSPENFTEDALLHEPGNFQWYTPSFVLAMQAFGWMGFHYGTSLAVLAFVSGLAGLFGYFHLFRMISRSEVFAFAAALGLWFLHTYYPASQSWTPTLVLPRTVYSALLPWVLCLTIWSLRRPRRWSIATAASGLLFYVHPVSSPALSGAILTAMVIAGGGRSRLKRLGWGLAAAGVAVAVMFPYILIYTSKYSGTVIADQIVIDRAMEVARDRLAPGFLDMGLFMRQIAGFLATNVRYWPGIAAVVWLLMRRRRRRPVRVLGAMALGYAIVTILIPAVDLLLANYLGRMPFQIDLIRNIRYGDVFLLAVFGIAWRETRRGRAAWRWPLDVPLKFGPVTLPGRLRITKTLAVTVLVVIAVGDGRLLKSARKLVRMCRVNVDVLRAKPPVEVADELETVRVLGVLRRPGEVVGGPLHLRQSHVPLAYIHKDLGALSCANPVGLVEARDALDDARPHLQWPVTLDSARTAARILQADLLILDRAKAAPSLVRSEAVVFQNGSVILLRIPLGTAR